MGVGDVVKTKYNYCGDKGVLMHIIQKQGNIVAVAVGDKEFHENINNLIKVR